MSSNPHLVPVPRWHHGLPGEGEPVVYAVHGRGQDPGYLTAVADRIDLPGPSWLLPSADGASWYPESFLLPVERNQPRLDQALAAVAAHLDALFDDGVPLARTVLLGFSQGACLLSEHLLRTRRRYAAGVLLTGGYVDPAALEAARADTSRPLAGMPVLMACSRRDEFVPLERVNPTADVLRGLGADVDLRLTDDPEHHVDDDAVHATRGLLAALATPTSTPTPPTRERST